MTYIRIPVPRLSPVLGSNLLGVAGLIAIVCAIAALTSWKWGLLAAGVFAIALTVIAQSQGAGSVPAGANVSTIESGRRSRISATAEAQLATERARTEATG